MVTSSVVLSEVKDLQIDKNHNPMKRISLFMMMAVALAGCQESMENIVLSEKTQTFEAITEGFEGNTKTSIDNQKNIQWSENDQLAIFQGCSIADKYQVTAETAGTGNGTFELIADNSGDVNDDFNSGVEIATNIALYPYADGLSVSNANVTNDNDVGAYQITGFVLPEIQHYASGSFGEGSFPMVAVTETMTDHTLKFKNLMGAIKLQLKGTQKIKSIKIEGKGNEKLSGAATFTAYPNEYAPVLTMSDEANTSVTLDCSDGVQLSESTATDFIIALPPVLFSKGFTVTLMDSEMTETIIETNTANIVLRSSILIMPILKIGETISEDNQEDSSVIKISSIVLDRNELVMLPNTSIALVVKIAPVDATDRKIIWSSDNPIVAQVDDKGKITALADGTACISAIAGDVVETCSVEVVSSETVAMRDYIDEYGINHGEGTLIVNTVWAPVNCGYRSPYTGEDGKEYKGFPYGKLYQWGRKYGQGFGEGYDDGVVEIVDGPFSLSGAQNKMYEDKFIRVTSEFGYNWLSEENDNLWNSGTEDVPLKTDNDPCPDGWRVPTYNEMINLKYSHDGTSGDNGMIFYGIYTHVSGLSIPSVFLPTGGYREEYGRLSYRYDVMNDGGYYWCSKIEDYEYTSRRGYPVGLSFSDANYVCVHTTGSRGEYWWRTTALSVRCVQE